MANSGLDSRRKCENLISQGRVKINGRVANLGARVDPAKDLVTLDGKKIEFTKNDKLYIMLNKPRGFVTTLSDEKGRKCVADLVKDINARIYPVGRLDKDSEGLLIMTNDGNFANNLIHPSKNLWKTYRVTVKPSINEDQLNALSMREVLDRQKDRSILKISIKEGKNRQIRKMCEKVGLAVARLKRISIGQIKLGMLPPGKWRNLKEDEINLLIKKSKDEESRHL